MRLRVRLVGTRGELAEWIHPRPVVGLYLGLAVRIGSGPDLRPCLRLAQRIGSWSDLNPCRRVSASESCVAESAGPPGGPRAPEAGPGAGRGAVDPRLVPGRPRAGLGGANLEDLGLRTGGQAAEDADPRAPGRGARLHGRGALRAAVDHAPPPRPPAGGGNGAGGGGGRAPGGAGGGAW